MTGDITCDGILNQKLVLYQYKMGYRVAVDSILVGAMVDLSAKNILDLGAGVGAVSLVAQYWNRLAQYHAVENNIDYFHLLKKNLLKANLSLRRGKKMTTHHCDIKTFADNPHHREKFCQVLCNPPFDNIDDTTPPPDGLKRSAFVFQSGDNMLDWWQAGLAVLRLGGRLSFITRFDMKKTIIDFFSQYKGLLTMQSVVANDRTIRWLVDFKKLPNNMGDVITPPDFILQTTKKNGTHYTPKADAILAGEAYHHFPF
ncbi:MAG: methyltransferase [Alphaproteobacteria bacterium]